MGFCRVQRPSNTKGAGDGLGGADQGANGKTGSGGRNVWLIFVSRTDSFPIMRSTRVGTSPSAESTGSSSDEMRGLMLISYSAGSEGLS